MIRYHMALETQVSIVFRCCESIPLEVPLVYGKDDDFQTAVGREKSGLVVGIGLERDGFVGSWTQKRRDAIIYLFVPENISFKLSLFSSFLLLRSLVCNCYD